MAKYYNKKPKVGMTFYIEESEGFKHVLTNLTEPAPTIFETNEGTEVRFNILIDSEESFLKYHALDHLKDKAIVVGIIYDNNIELKSRFTVDHYERRFGSDKGSIVTHVLRGSK